MLDIFISIVVRSELVRILPTKYIAYKSSYNLTCLFLIYIFLLKSSIDLSMS